MLNELADEITNWRIQKGFNTPADIETEEQRDMMLGKLMLVVTEVSEMCEAVRSKDRVNFREEMADVFIRMLDIVGTMRVDIEYEIQLKMEKNKKRPFKHGRKTSL